LCFKFSLSHNFPVGERHRLVAGSTGGCPHLPAKKHDALLGNVIKLSGLFVRLHRSRIFIGMHIYYKYATATRSNVLYLMALPIGTKLMKCLTK